MHRGCSISAPDEVGEEDGEGACGLNPGQRNLPSFNQKTGPFHKYANVK